MNWQRIIWRTTQAIAARARIGATLLAEDLPLLADFSQLNRRTRRAVRSGRMTRAAYLLLRHQQRRFARRREIRALVGG